MEKQKKLGVVSLGCSKNLVDTEMAIGLFQENGFLIVTKPEEADVILINTCGFIEPAKEEAINTILEMAEYKKKKCKTLIVMGCLVQRYKEELAKEIPEVDLWIKFQEYDDFWKQVQDVITSATKKEELCFEDRVISTGENYAYLRIAEGCSNYCTYCAIPSIRGAFKSRTIEDILKEAKSLAKKGYQELIVIAQDTTKYGIDLYGKPRLAELLEQLTKIEGIHWVRFLYAYPETITDELIEVVKKNKKICSYFDIPIQHIANPVLKRMNRKSDEESIRKLIQKLKEQIPDVIIRTTVMVGFPGETKEDFDLLQNLIQTTKFDKLGAFCYSKEENTPAEKLPNQIHPQTKKSRYRKIMELQQQVSKENLAKKIGKTYEVFVEGMSYDKSYYIGRSYMDVPEIDGYIWIKADEELTLGKFYPVEIEKVQEYDLIGRVKQGKKS